MVNILKLFTGKKRRIDDDPRIYVKKDISIEDFIRVNDQSYEYREKVLPAALTVEFWRGSGLVNFLLDGRFLKSEILDVGCGSGEIDIIIAEKDYIITAIDISPYAIHLAHKLAEGFPECKGRFDFLVGNIEQMDFNKKFSSAIISHTLEHVINPEKMMERVIKLLNPGSYILVAVPNKKAWNDRTHLRHYSERGLRKFLSLYSHEIEIKIDKVEKMIFAVLRVPDSQHLKTQ
ncbi:MAG: class I SAM-dependent methyltransferase [Proteobacteria bacterium]|nr:class I SAM-dependent methyltransferase [Pseudomonadota bacterium]